MGENKEVDVLAVFVELTVHVGEFQMWTWSFEHETSKNTDCVAAMQLQESSHDK